MSKISLSFNQMTKLRAGEQPVYHSRADLYPINFVGLLNSSAHRLAILLPSFKAIAYFLCKTTPTYGGHAAAIKTRLQHVCLGLSKQSTEKLAGLGNFRREGEMNIFVDKREMNYFGALLPEKFCCRVYQIVRR